MFAMVAAKQMLIAALLLISGTIASAATYTIINLSPRLPSTWRFLGNDVGSNANHFLGMGYSSPGPAGQYTFIYRNGIVTRIGTLPGATFTLGNDHNHAGQVTGAAFTVDPNGYTFTATRAFLYSNGKLTDLSELGAFKGRESFGHAINKKGQVVGNWTDATNVARAFLYSNGKMITDIGSLGPGTGTRANAINNVGQITGQSSAGQWPHAFLYDKGSMQDIGALTAPPSDFSLGVGINDAGQIIGRSRVDNFHTHGFIYENGVMKDMGTLGGSESYPVQINNAGVVVGYSTPAGANVGSHLAFVFSNGKMQAINAAIDTADPLFTRISHTEAVAINDAGEIVTKGVDQRTGLVNYYLLRPKPSATRQRSR
ncbi:MAG: hypothetical protein H7Y02_03820 [Candidatus Obscuribacterales bacterium]|nr:hypothetical protein [Steroidobacteraceae bacterium]